MKTKLGIVVIDDDKETARKRLKQISRIPEEQINEFGIYGAPEDVLREKESLQDAGRTVSSELKTS